MAFQRRKDVWKPLDSRQRQIRLLVLHENPDLLAPPVGHLEVVSLDDRPEYDAISYAWGEVGEVKSVYLHGHRLAITVSLEACLRRFRAQLPNTRFWCDALSINQDDTEEKSHQIRIMQKIFAQSQRVRVWLYRKDRHHQMRSIMDLMNEAGSDPKIAQSWSPSDIRLDGEALSVQNRHKLAVFCTDPWWQRVWTMQEFALAEHVSFHFQARVADYVQVDDFWQFVFGRCCIERLSGDRGVDGLSVFDLLEQHIVLGELRQLKVRDRRNGSASSPSVSLTRLLAASRRRLVTDPKDRVFGLLALCTTLLGIPAMPVDYTKPLDRVYVEFAKWLLEHSESCVLLTQAGFTYNRLRSLPFWVPDWSSAYNFGTERDRLNYFLKFNATKGKQKSVAFDGDHLGLDAWFVDIVARVGQICDEPFVGFVKTKIANAIHDWERVCKAAFSDDLAQRNYVAGGRVSDAFYRTLYCDDLYAPSLDGSLSFAEASRKLGDLSYDRIIQEPATIFDDALGAMQMAISKRRFFITRRGYIGLGPCDTAVQDDVYLLGGSTVPFLLRQIEQPQSYRMGRRSEQFFLVGDCYLDGIMYGELFERDHPPPRESVWLH